MNYVDKKIALQYLANSELIFNKLKNSFLNSYKDGEATITKLVNDKNIDELYRYIHSIKGISLNVGSQVLYDDSVLVLEKLKKEEIDLPLIKRFIETLRFVCKELEKL